MIDGQEKDDRLWFWSHPTEPLAWCRNEGSWKCPSNEWVTLVSTEDKACHEGVMPEGGYWVESEL